MKLLRTSAAVGLLLFNLDTARCAEPNQTVAAATELGPSVRSVSDELTAGLPPDTVLGIRDTFGVIDPMTGVDDDGSHLGDPSASGMYGVATNSGALNFAITGWPNYDFAGGHQISGEYQVFVEVFDDFHEDPIATFNEIRTLEADAVHEFSYFNENWLFGTYNAFIDNTIGPGAVGDVDFFTFTGLTPGESFSVETLAPGSPTADTYLGWFNATGELIGFHDDVDEQNFLSRISGTVPAEGRLTFAVTGVGDEEFVGRHVEQYPYELHLTTGATMPGDFNGDRVIDAADLLAWQNGYGPSGAADADDDDDADGEDFLVWQRALGGGVVTPATATIPEPSGAVLMLLAVVWRPMGSARRWLVQRS